VSGIFGFTHRASRAQAREAIQRGKLSKPDPVGQLGETA
jgi:hypothetical protein